MHSTIRGIRSTPLVSVLGANAATSPPRAVCGSVLVALTPGRAQHCSRGIVTASWQSQHPFLAARRPVWLFDDVTRTSSTYMSTIAYQSTESYDRDCGTWNSRSYRFHCDALSETIEKPIQAIPCATKERGGTRRAAENSIWCHTLTAV